MSGEPDPLYACVRTRLCKYRLRDCLTRWRSEHGWSLVVHAAGAPTAEAVPRQRIVDDGVRQQYDDVVEVVPSARKHDIDDADIFHAIRNPYRYVEQEYDGELRLLIIGPARDGSLLEVVVVPLDDPQRVIHADHLRPKFYDFL